MTAEASRTASSRSRPPERGHAGTSRPKARRIRSAQRQPRPHGPAADAEEGGSEADDARASGTMSPTPRRPRREHPVIQHQA
ncbi:MAG: hypothetical protein LC749_21925, partial [Actinobacteria bacterium]|nr:hypothetical protein [Actinomycetota bacterium]